MTREETGVYHPGTERHDEAPLLHAGAGPLERYAPYWGTYTVDANAGVVVHHVQSDARNTHIGTDQPRPFKLEVDRLVIGDGRTLTRVLERVR